MNQSLDLKGKHINTRKPTTKIAKLETIFRLIKFFNHPRMQHGCFLDLTVNPRPCSVHRVLVPQAATHNADAPVYIRQGWDTAADGKLYFREPLTLFTTINCMALPQTVLDLWRIYIPSSEILKSFWWETFVHAFARQNSFWNEVGQKSKVQPQIRLGSVTSCSGPRSCGCHTSLKALPGCN